VGRNEVGKAIKGRFSEVFIFKEILTAYKRKNDERGRWKKENLEWAINAFKGKTMVINAASRTFGIRSRTLRRRILQDNYKNKLSVQVPV
jgi:hypothetical protein